MLVNTIPSRNNSKKSKTLSYGQSYKSTQLQYELNSNNHILDTTTKTTVPNPDSFHDQITTQNSNFDCNSFSYYSSPSTLVKRRNTVYNFTYVTSSKGNNTEQNAIGDPTEL